MIAQVIHLDSEKSWRGGQQQAVYLYESMISKGLNTTFFAKRGSAVSKYLFVKGLSCNEAPMLGEMDLFSAIKIANYAKKFNYNILHCHSSHSLSIGLLASMLGRNLSVIASRRVPFHIRNGILSKIKYSHKNLKNIVCVSDAICKVLKGDGLESNKLCVIKDGIILDKFNESSGAKIRNELSTSNQIIIGTVAAFEREKDYPNLVSAAEIVLSKRKNVRFLAVGDGSMLEEMKSKVRELNIDDRFIFAGYQSNIGDYLKSFDIFVLPSRMEGLGTSILDAMSVGLPIVACRVGGIPEAVADRSNGILVERNNHEQLANALIELIDNAELRSEFGQSSLKLVQNFDIEDTVARNIKLYDKVIEEFK